MSLAPATPPPPHRSDDGSTGSLAQTVFEALRTVATAGVGQAGYRDELAVPYLRRHLADHAASAGRLDDLVVDPEFLIHADPDTLIPLLPEARTISARLAAAVYRTSLGRHRQVDPDTRRKLLALDAQRFGAPELANRIDPWIGPERIRWATGSQVSPQIRTTMTGHSISVTAVACTVLDGRPVAVTGGWDVTAAAPATINAGAAECGSGT